MGLSLLTAADGHVKHFSRLMSSSRVLFSISCFKKVFCYRTPPSSPRPISPST